jgi:hypothetical protein
MSTRTETLKRLTVGPLFLAVAAVLAILFLLILLLRMLADVGYALVTGDRYFDANSRYGYYLFRWIPDNIQWMLTGRGEFELRP